RSLIASAIRFVKKSWIGIVSEPARRTLSYINLVAIVVMMMAVVAGNSIAIVPIVVSIVRRAITIVSIWPIVSVRVIAVSIRIVAIPVTWITEPNSYAPDSD